MPVPPHRRQDENLRIDLAFEFHDQADDAGLVTPGPQQLDVGIVGSDLVSQAFEHIVQLDAFEVDDQALRVLDDEMGIFQGGSVFDRHPRIVWCRPDAYRQNARVAVGSGGRQRTDRQQ
jgi:hypothetical protein